ncbi:MAG: NADH-quinone oxidoreductase subunit L [Polyangiaceae bacterium]|nr:NADH-quinone oxidoreductase subunit L [Polyangiaceae bacterium]MCL4753859.1 NADH-quinone oxidoreductase subunit L [Myxococcales bacterium]
MDGLQKIFPPGEFALLAVILALPLIGAIVNGIFGKRLGKQAVTMMALVAVGGSFLASLVSFLLLRNAQAAAHAKGAEGAVRFIWQGWEWVRVSGRHDMAQVPLEVAFSFDALNGVMSLVVTGVGFLIHLYSTKYMEQDAGYHRFFAYLNLFVFSMLVLILGNSLPVLFVGWEGVGLCSYLLIGFWFEGEQNAAAGKKAFITNRIGDFGLIVAMALILYYVGSLDWSGIEGGRMNLLTKVQMWPIGNQVPGTGLIQNSLPSVAEWLNRPRFVTAATLVGLALFLGCAGKSAQFPLYVWLPDAMAGPTPVSALIHAATMVTAGVYLVCRMAGVFVLSPAAMFTIALVGAFTALLAASIAFVQNDIKKVLAYSTVSQLGYMFLGVGVGAFTAGFFHVVTHAFFKACLFLAAGSVIYAMHKRIHDTDASQDMRNMGGMKKYMPFTFAAFVMAWVAIIGVPGTSGFFSKDEILFKAYTSSVAFPIPDGKMIDPRTGKVALQMFGWPSWGPTVLYAMGVIGAVMTAFYMSRLVFGIFWGDFKGWKVVKGWKEPEHEEHHDEHHGHHGEALEGPKPKESPWQITAPILILGGLSVVAGFLNAHPLHIAPLEHFLEPVFSFANGTKEVVAAGTKGPGVVLHPNSQSLMWPLMAPGLLALVAGAGGAFYVYMQQAGGPAKMLAEKFPGLHALVYDKWRVDELYEETIIGAVDSLAEFAVVFDKVVVDGIVARLTSFVVAAAGTGLRFVQTGHAQAYAAVMVVGAGGLGWFFIAPHASVTVKPDEAGGTYEVSAAPGLGYQYRWDSDGDGKPDSERFSSQATLPVPLERGKSKKVVLEVKNAFERVSKREIVLSRPKLDASRGPGPGVIQVEQGPDGQLRGVLPGQNRPVPLRPQGGLPQPGAEPGQPPPGGMPMRMPPPGRPNPAEPPHQHQPGDVH